LSTQRTGTQVLALLAGSALALSACATSSSGGSGAASSATSAPITITWGYAQEFSGYNSNTNDGVSLSNTVVLNQVQRGFVYFAPDGTIARDKDFGTFEKTSDSPLTVKYSINPEAVWSDGKQVECDDVVLTWLANSNTTGDKGFSSASTTGYDQMNAPACKAGDKEFTVTYKEPFADWEAVFNWTSILPAHIVEAQAGMTKTFVDYVANPASPELAKAIEFYNKGWQFNPGQLKKDIIPSMGPYSIDSWTGGQSLTLKANPKWWGAPAKAQTIVIRIIADDAQAQALQNGEINVMEPQPQVDIVNQLKQLGDKVKVQSGDQFSFEHLDFNFKGAFADKRLREAFALCVPRQEIVNNLIVPQNPNAKILESRFIYPFQPQYEDFASGVGGAAYDTVNLAKAKQLVTAAGKTGVTVKIGWRKNPTAPNKRRADTIALVKASCAQAGFNVVDAGTNTFFDKELPNGNFDVALFAWIGSPLVTSNAAIYQTKAGGRGGQNNGQYSNPTVDKDLDGLNKELDKDKQLALLKKVDTQLWTDLATIPLFAFPNIVATDNKVENVTMNTTQQDLTWNAQEWNLKQ
jgi:ABC-type transport system substrate-binding protein